MDFVNYVADINGRISYKHNAKRIESRLEDLGCMNIVVCPNKPGDILFVEFACEQDKFEAAREFLGDDWTFTEEYFVNKKGGE